jgi:hypothetical protein
MPVPNVQIEPTMLNNVRPTFWTDLEGCSVQIYEDFGQFQYMPVPNVQIEPTMLNNVRPTFWTGLEGFLVQIYEDFGHLTR